MSDEGNGVKALLNLTSTLLDGANPNDSESMLNIIGHVVGICQYVQEYVLGVEADNDLYAKAILEGLEMALVFASNFDFRVPGVAYISIHEGHPGKGGEPITPNRVRTYMIDIHGNGEYMNITNIMFVFDEPTEMKLNYVGMWDAPEEGTLLDVGEMRVGLDLAGRDSLSLAPGGLRTKYQSVAAS